jgi:hypothetical protein
MLEIHFFPHIDQSISSVLKFVTHYGVLVGKPEGKRPLGRPRRRWEDNIKTNLQEVGYGGMDCIELVKVRDRWRALVHAVMDLRVP